MTDSTEILATLEREIVNDRRLTHPDPGIAFLSDLIEDMADEWLVKAMFLCRWIEPENAEHAARWIAAMIAPNSGVTKRTEIAAKLRLRQEERMGSVGSDPANRPVLEASLRRIARGLGAQFAGSAFLVGRRPLPMDYALFGQFSQLTIDAPAARIVAEEAPDVLPWIRRTADLSGYEAEWSPPDALHDSEALKPLLRECATRHLPFLEANAAAREAGEEVVMETEDGTFRQPAQSYPVKCLARLRARFAEAPLPSETLALLDDTGCLPILQHAP